MQISSVVHAFKIYKPEIEGGIPGIISILSHGLPSLFQHTIVVTTTGIEREDDVNGIKVIRVGSAGTFWSLPLAPSYPRRLARSARAADLIAMHAPFPLADLALLLPRTRQLRIVIHWHADIVRQRALKPLYAPLVRHTLRRAHTIVVSNDAVLENSAELLAVRDKVRVVPYGIDPKPWTDIDDADTEAITKLAAEEPFFLAVGRLVTYKGFDILIRAAAKSGVRVRIAGTGEEEPRLQQLIDSLGLNGRVSLEGFTPHYRLRQLLHAARALVMPSTTEAEAFGLVQVEAMFCGCPVINTALPTGVPWVARHEQEALTVAPKNVDSLAWALSRLSDDGPLARNLGTAGRARALSLFTAEAFCAAIGKIYNEALQSGNGN